MTDEAEAEEEFVQKEYASTLGELRFTWKLKVRVSKKLAWKKMQHLERLHCV